jgi:hypothetical protein
LIDKGSLERTCVAFVPLKAVCALSETATRAEIEAIVAVEIAARKLLSESSSARNSARLDNELLQERKRFPDLAS